MNRCMINVHVHYNKNIGMRSQLEWVIIHVHVNKFCIGDNEQYSLIYSRMQCVSLIAESGFSFTTSTARKL